jgi:hypothetical protein
MHTNSWIGRNVHLWAPIRIWNSKSESGKTLENWVSGRGPSAHGPQTVRVIKKWTVRSAMQTVWTHQGADRPPPLRGPSATGSKNRQRPQTCHLCYLFPLSCSPLAKYSSLSIVRGRRSDVAHGQSDSLWQRSINMSSSRYFINLVDFFKFLQVFEIIRVSSLIWN